MKTGYISNHQKLVILPKIACWVTGKVMARVVIPYYTRTMSKCSLLHMRVCGILLRSRIVSRSAIRGSGRTFLSVILPRWGWICRVLGSRLVAIYISMECYRWLQSLLCRRVFFSRRYARVVSRVLGGSRRRGAVHGDRVTFSSASLWYSYLRSSKTGLM